MTLPALPAGTESGRARPEDVDAEVEGEGEEEEDGDEEEDMKILSPPYGKSDTRS